MPNRQALVSRVRAADGRVLGYRIDGVGGPGSHAFSIVDAQHVPPFEGEAGWFEIRRVFATPWNYWKPVRWLGPERPQ
jgi:hypothetical protein